MVDMGNSHTAKGRNPPSDPVRSPGVVNMPASACRTMQITPRPLPNGQVGNGVLSPTRSVSYRGMTRTKWSPANPGRFTGLAMEALEGMLCFAAYMCWAEHSSITDEQPIRFNRNWKRSAGPLKKLLFDCVDTRSSGSFITTFRRELDA